MQRAGSDSNILPRPGQIGFPVVPESRGSQMSERLQRDDSDKQVALVQCIEPQSGVDRRFPDLTLGRVVALPRRAVRKPSVLVNT